MKYIEAEKLIAELRKHLIPVLLDKNYDEWEHGEDSGFRQAISIAESLQQEQPEVEGKVHHIGNVHYIVTNLKEFKDCARVVIHINARKEE